MLFGYPIESFENNWLHEALIEMLGTDLDLIDAGNDWEPWPVCIPAHYLAKLEARHGLRDRRRNFLQAYSNLSDVDRAAVRNAMQRQNQIPDVFNDLDPCPTLDDLNQTIRESAKALFKFAFEILTGLGLRDANYALFYENLSHRVCAFCGLEPLDSSEQKREALDHYLVFDRYPFAGANFRNLSPMGNKCNSRYKLQQDILIDSDTGGRRRCCDPYASPEIELRLHNSRPFEGVTTNLTICPDWEIEWDGGDADRLNVWETVFDIPNRIRGSSLNPNFRDWVSHFALWAARAKGQLNQRDHMREALREFAEIVLPEGYSDQAFLKRATILMLSVKCDQTDDGERLHSWLVDLVSNYADSEPMAA
ncbi:MAG: hypothetical protein Pars2KO_32340 [Parasphingorhabdus sp.]